MKKPDISIIYVDMDGVIADFRKAYLEMFGIDPMDSHLHKSMRKNWDKFVDEGGFAELDRMPDAMIGLNFLKTIKDIPIEILSSTANEKQYDMISSQKKKWLENHKITYPANFVPGKKHKREYAEKGAILIDDTLVTIEQWNEAGGVGIYHTDWITTTTILNLYV